MSKRGVEELFSQGDTSSSVSGSVGKIFDQLFGDVFWDNGGILPGNDRSYRPPQGWFQISGGELNTLWLTPGGSVSSAPSQHEGLSRTLVSSGAAGRLFAAYREEQDVVVHSPNFGEVYPIGWNVTPERWMLYASFAEMGAKHSPHAGSWSGDAANPDTVALHLAALDSDGATHEIRGIGTAIVTRETLKTRRNARDTGKTPPALPIVFDPKYAQLLGEDGMEAIRTFV